MTKYDSYEKAREALLPKETKEHFEAYRKSCKKNIRIIESFANKVDFEGERAIHIVLEKIYRDMNTLSDEIEVAFVGNFYTQKITVEAISDIMAKLEELGVKTDFIQKHEQNLEWINKFFRKESKVDDAHKDE